MTNEQIPWGVNLTENTERPRDLERYAAIPLPATDILKRTLEASRKYREGADNSTHNDAASTPDAEIQVTAIPEHHIARAMHMAKKLEHYLTPEALNPRIAFMLHRIPAEVLAGNTGETITHIKARIRERIIRAVHFFVSPAPEWPLSPLMHMAQALDSIPVPPEESHRGKVATAMKAYMDNLIELAFEQQWQDPPQFASHAWDHSLRVADHGIHLVQGLSETGRFEDSPIIRTMMEKYRITAQEVQLLLHHTHVCHDCGYPHLKGREKSLHAVNGAELAMSDQIVQSLRTFIQSPNADMDKLTHDMYEAIFYHGADVAQKHFAVRIVTNRGTFLCSNENITPVLHSLMDTTTHTPRTFLRVELAGAQSNDAKVTAQQTIQGVLPNCPTRVLDGNPFFIGRSLDLQSKNDKLAGIEQTKADMQEKPLLALLRIADNMDLTSHRLGRVRHHEAYYEVIRRIGRGGSEYDLFVELEKEHGDEAGVEQAKQRILAHFGERANREQIDAIRNLQQARDAVSHIVVHEVLSQPKYASLPSAESVDPSDHATITRERIIETCYKMRSDVVEHQGGCLATEKIELVRHNGSGYAFKLHFNRKRFDELRRVEFTERGYDDRLNKITYTVNAAEYQRWRLEQALPSNIVRDAHGKEIHIGIIMVYADNGERILPPHDDDTDEENPY